MRRLLAHLLRRFQNHDYIYAGALPEGYPLPGSEFLYNGKVGIIDFYVIVISDWDNTADIQAVVHYNGLSGLIYSAEMIGLKPSRVEV